MAGETDFSSLRILVVDDEAFMRTLIVRILNEIGVVDALTARNGDEGLAVIDKESRVPDLVICDLEMPEMDGFEFVRQLRKSEYATLQRMPVLIVTGHAEPHNIYDAVDAGIHGYLVKPVSRKALESRMATALTSDPIDPARVPR